MKKKLLALLALISLAACGGGGGHSSSLPPTRPLPETQPSSTPAAATDMSFVVDIPSTAPQSAARKRNYVSASTQSVTIGLQGGATLGAFDVSSTSKLCSSTSIGRSCTIAVTAPAGSDTFVIKAYDQQNGGGTLLESGNVVQTVSASQSTTVNVSLQLSGAVSKYLLAIGNPFANGGTPSSTSVTVEALDPDGHVVIGAFDRTITLQNSDTTGATKLSGTISINDSSQQATLSYDGSAFRTATITASIPNMQPLTQTFTVTPAMVNYGPVDPINTANGLDDAGATGSALGPDGNIWAAGAIAGGIVRIAPDGTQASFETPSGNTFPQYIVAGKDGAMWFTESSGNNIGRITMQGQITEYPLPTQWAWPTGITCGPDGTIWFAEGSENQIGKLDPATGNITEYVIPGNFVLPTDLTIGPDGNVWIDTLNAIIVMTQSGQGVANYPLPRKFSNPNGIMIGLDGNLWFGEYNYPYLDRITPDGKLTSFATPDADPAIMVITNGPDGNIWFGESNNGLAPAGTVGYINPVTDKITLVPLNIQLHVRGLSFDKKNNLWFTGNESAPSAWGEVVY
jgi:virginiamycin B lyase